MGNSSSPTGKEPKSVDVPLYQDEAEEEDDDFSNVALSDDDKSVKAKVGFLGQLKMKTGGKGGNIEEANDAPKETILGHIKNTAGSAGAAIESAGGAIIGGIKATGHMLNPLGGENRNSEPAIDPKQIEEDFSKIEIEDDPELCPVAPADKPKAPVGIFGHLKASVGLANEEPTDGLPKESFLESVKVKTGLVQKDDGIAHNSAPKEGFMGHLKATTSSIGSIIPFGSGAETKAAAPPPVPVAHDTGKPNRFQQHREQSRSSITSSSKSASSSGGLFDSLTGKSSAPAPRPKSEPVQESFIDSLLGKPAPPPKEPTMFEKMTGSGSTTNKSEGFW